MGRLRGLEEAIGLIGLGSIDTVGTRSEEYRKIIEKYRINR
jgi:hypothetical protein